VQRGLRVSISRICYFVATQKDSSVLTQYNWAEIFNLAQGEPVKRNLTRITIHAVLAASILLGASWLAQSTSQARATRESPGLAAPLGPYDIYVPLVARQVLPPMVELQAAYLANASGNPQAAFLPGGALLYTTKGRNDFYYPVNVTRRWMQDGPQSGPGACGDGTLFSNTLNLAPGAWQDTVPGAAASCEGIYTAAVDVTNGVETRALAMQYVVNPPSQVVLETRQAFDRCTLPSLAQMQAWWELGPYWVFNIYLGGSMFYCQNDIPGAAWVHAASRQGWSFILTWVGPQAPCTEFRDRMSSDLTAAYNQGRSEAALAVEAARQRGFLGNMAIYYDLEGYGSTAGQACRDAADSFMRGWAGRLHELGVVAGGYGSPASSHIADWANNNPPPDDVWIAHWLTPAQYRPGATTDSSYLDDSLWANHQRLRQYAGGHSETWGNVTMIIDSSAVDGAVTCIPLPGAVCGQNLLHSDPQAEFNKSASLDGGVTIQAAELLTPSWGWTLADNRLLSTADGGANWTEITPQTSSQGAILGVKFLNAQRGWLVSEADGSLTMLSTQDGGLTWNSRPLEIGSTSSPVAGASLEFLDESTGWLALRLQSSSSFSLGLLLATQDGGITWQERSLPLGEAARFRDPLHGWTAGGPDGSQLFSTQDGGFTWQAQQLELPPDLPAGRLTVGLPQVNPDGSAYLPVTVVGSDGSNALLVYQSSSGVDWELASTVDHPLSMADMAAANLCTDLPCEARILSAAKDLALPQSMTVTSLDLVTPTQGWALAQQGLCNGGKATGAPQSCQQYTRLYATKDGGQSWIDISPP